ncbi:MAG: NAD(P)-dependent oxidoreductase [Rhizobiales bacterium]|nr:NAD(P)-dependent oxidoreductase [Hyphomicrobiales bacterium]
MKQEPRLRIGVIGTGFVSRHFVQELARRTTYELGKVLTRRPLESCGEYPRQDALTDSVDALIEASDIIFECTGDVPHAAETVGPVLDAGRPVVTLNAEFHTTIGSHFVDRGLLTEAEGDQPGCLAALHEEAVAMGFEPLAYGNMKAFLNRNPSPEDMKFWAEKQGYSLPMVTSFTDGTKVQIEQCLVANGLNAGIAQEDLLGLETGDVKHAAQELGKAADRLGYPISEYILDRGLPHGVFIVARHDEAQKQPLMNCKLGEGPYYLLIKDHCLVHLEVFKTIERVAEGRPPLLNNSRTPTIGVAAVAKRDLAPGTVIERGCGSFDLRGICVNIAERPDHLPICLANDLRLKHPVEAGAVLTADDVDMPESDAWKMWQAIRETSLSRFKLAS